MLANYNLTAHSLRSFEPQRAQSFYSFFLSADPGGIGSAPEKHTSCFTGQAFHRAEEGRKEKTTSLREGIETVHDTSSVLIEEIFATEWLIVFICRRLSGK